MSELGALSSYAQASRALQLSFIKSNAEAQQQVVDIILENTESLKVAHSGSHGNFVDVTI